MSEQLRRRLQDAYDRAREDHADLRVVFSRLFERGDLTDAARGERRVVEAEWLRVAEIHDLFLGPESTRMEAMGQASRRRQEAERRGEPQEQQQELARELRLFRQAVLSGGQDDEALRTLVPEAEASARRLTMILDQFLGGR